MKLKNMPIFERPRERLIKYGSDSLSNEELLSIILKTGTKNFSVKELANELLNEVGDINNLKNMTVNGLTNFKGIGKVKAIELMAVIELGKRMYECVKYEDIIRCCDPINIVKYFEYLFRDKKQEEFYVLYLDKKKKLLGKKKLFVGTVDLSLSHPRDIFRDAYLYSCSYIICIHNHPSGDASPSREDCVLTENIKEIGRIHAILLLDHIIIGDGNYYSFYENNYILGSS